MVALWKRTAGAVVLGVALSLAGPIAGQAQEELAPGLQAQIAAAVQSDDEAQVSEAIRALVAANPGLAAQIAAAAARIRPRIACAIAGPTAAAAPGAAAAIAAALATVAPEAAACTAAAAARAVPALAGEIFLAVAAIVPEAAVNIAAAIANAVPDTADTVATLLDESGLAGPAPSVPAGIVSDTAENPAIASPTGL